jgi:phosphatidylglycerophosphate synthase
MGSVLDIAADRTYELALWVAFTHLGLVSPLIPLVVLARTALTDALRSVGVAEGVPPFGQQRSRVARFIVGSSWMRSGYAATKVTAFCGLALAHAFLGYPDGSAPRAAADGLLAASQAVAWIAVLLCLVRGAPVVVEGLSRRHEAAGC